MIRLNENGFITTMSDTIIYNNNGFRVFSINIYITI